MQMVDLKGQYLRIKEEIDAAIAEVIDSSAFINGPHVDRFASNLAEYLNVPHVVTCANGTDALQIALMALNLQPGDEVIVPAFTYVATAEVVCLLGLVPVLVDVNKNNFNIDTELLENTLSHRTRAIIPVHLFGQCANMKKVMTFAKAHNLFVIEDAAQALGAKYMGQSAGILGDIGCTSFFPSKNLGCFGDGGALITKDAVLAERVKMIANHGQRKKYLHQILGCNSRLDTLQAAILNVKLNHLDEFQTARTQAALRYTKALQGIEGVFCPTEEPYSTHVYHQYTLRILHGKRDLLQHHLASNGIPTAIYYPLPLHHQEAYRTTVRIAGALTVSEQLCKEVLSIPMHTELTPELQNRITSQIKDFFNHQ
jgi:dTDP-4-amino-4,6-dideoxygalactose transaminase